MYVHKVKLQNFRNFESLDIELSRGANIFHGGNAQGKTNFLESVYMCSTGRSQRATQDRELIRFNETEAHIQLVAGRNISEGFSFGTKIDIHLKKEQPKGVAVNSVPIRKLGELFGVLHCVIFSPEDLQFVKAGPSERRRFMDIILCQISNIYYYDLQQYYRVLRQRNNLLKDIKKNTSLKETLFLWDEQLVSHGIKILAHRAGFIEMLKEVSHSIHASITNNTESLSIVYKPNVTESEFLEKLRRGAERDIILGSTQHGVHKDDLTIMIDGSEARVYGSQGQQRTACLSAKLAEIDIIHKHTGKMPILLLDDVLSELDSSRQKYLLETINGKAPSEGAALPRGPMQAIITCTGMDEALGRFAKGANVYKVRDGAIARE